MIGSPDVLAFRGTEGFGDEVEHRRGGHRALPEELSVPPLPPSNPWMTAAQHHSDFILVAEFSEQVGPKPVLTIPDDPRVLGTFDLNHFSVRLMSVDYQAPYPGSASPSSHGPRIHFTEDSKVVMGDSAEGAFAYVQHLTLYDLEARGMVRPFCMAYVSSDQTKLMEHFSELSACFSQASDSLKTGNRRAFATELQRKLQELEYTRMTLQEGVELRKPADELAAHELAAVERSILDHRDLLRQVTSYPNRKLKQPDFLPYDPADSLTDPNGLSGPEFYLSPPSSPSGGLENRLKPLEELSDAYFLSVTLQQLADTEQRLHSDRSVLNTARVARRLSRRLHLTNFLFELWNSEEEEEEEGEDRVPGSKVARGSRGGTEPLAAAQPSLESFFSCVEELPIKLEARDGGAVTPDPEVAAGLAGSVSSGDSIEVLGTEKSYRTQRLVRGSDNSDRDTPVGTTDSGFRRPAAEAGVRHVRASTRRANSQDSIEILSTTESIFPDDLTAITEEEPNGRAPGDGIHGGGPKQRDDVSEEEGLVETAHRREKGKGLPVWSDKDVVDNESLKQFAFSNEIQREEESVRREQPLMRNPVCEDSKPDQMAAPQQVEEKAEMPVARHLTSGQSVEGVGVGPDLHRNFLQQASMPDGPFSPPCSPVRMLSVDEASDYTSSSEPPLPHTHALFGSRRSDPRMKRKAGLRALKFVQQNSFAQHAVFCLLSGRPLVVIGEESLVRKLLSALALFLPATGPDGNAVLPCLSAPLQLPDLLNWRLIGIHRSASTTSSVLPSLARYGRYLGLLDLDQRTLRCPPYSGSLIGRMVNPHAAICRGSTYLLHLESCLTALANQALLYTFNYALHPPGTSDRDGVSLGKDFLFERGLCSSEDDLRVMLFLSDLIKQHHTGRGPPIFSFSYRSVQTHRNTITT